MISKEKVRYFLLGVGGILIVLFLCGTSLNSGSALNFGRYQISTFATQIGDNSGITGAFILDTVTGNTKTAYIRSYGELPKGAVIKNDLRKPFSAID